ADVEAPDRHHVDAAGVRRPAVVERARRSHPDVVEVEVVQALAEHGFGRRRAADVARAEHEDVDRRSLPAPRQPDLAAAEMCGYERRLRAGGRAFADRGVLAGLSAAVAGAVEAGRARPPLAPPPFTGLGPLPLGGVLRAAPFA